MSNCIELQHLGYCWTGDMNILAKFEGPVNLHLFITFEL